MCLSHVAMSGVGCTLEVAQAILYADEYGQSLQALHVCLSNSLCLKAFWATC